MAVDEVVELDGATCADALTASQAALVEAERTQVELVAHWCDLHSTRGPARLPAPGAERSVVVAGDGTPAVGEFAAAELGVLLDLTTTGALGLMRDVLGLRHRHPRLFAAVRSGEARFFQARHVARLTRAAGLDLAQARHVDDRVAPFIGKVTWGRLVSLAEAAVIEADPEAAEERRVAAELQRFVRTGRSSVLGTTMIYARARSGDAVFFLAMCDRIAQILKLRGSHEVAGIARRDVDGADAALEMDVLRSEAVGVLATPARALALLQWAEAHLRDDDEPEPEPRDSVVVLDGSLDLDALRSKAVLHVHVSQESFLGEGRGVARVEGVGPVTLEQCRAFLQHCRVVVRPVIDLNGNPSADGYEVSPLVRETMELRSPVEAFPWGTASSRRADADHRRPYRGAAEPGAPGGPPPEPQTCADNLQPLGRLHHRLKTHGGWRCTAPARGVTLWRSPHGHWVRVDPSGTTYLGRLEGAPEVGQVVAAHLELLTGSPVLG